jgi:hypothetical protein
MSARVTHIAPKHAVDTFSTHVIAYRNQQSRECLYREDVARALAAGPQHHRAGAADLALILIT